MKTTYKSTLIFSTIALLLSASHSYAATLGSFSGGFNSSFDIVQTQVSFATDIIASDDGIYDTLFTNLNAGLGDIGTTYIEDATTSSSFDNITSLLTNGVNNYIGYTVGHGGAGGSESNMLYNDHTGEYAIDFSGGVIDQISFTLDSYAYNESLSYYNGTFTVAFLGTGGPFPDRLIDEPSPPLPPVPPSEVPIPGALWLMISGLFVFATRLRLKS